MFGSAAGDGRLGQCFICDFRDSARFLLVLHRIPLIVRDRGRSVQSGGANEALLIHIMEGSRSASRTRTQAFSTRDATGITSRMEWENESVPNRRFLVVDDNRDAADSFAMLLKLLGNEVATAHDGHSAIDAASTFKPDIVFLDIGLPGMSGYEVARRLRESASTLTLVAVTGWGEEEDRQRSREAGFDHHLVKPVELSTLEKLIASRSPQG
jgi:CheY-like chemotaxis protein